MAERKKPKNSEAAAAEGPVPVGAALRAARLAKKMEIDDVAHAINIRPAQVRAIEENDIASLPGMTYAVGFVRAYANFIGLNGADVVHRFKAEQGHEQPQADLTFPEPIAESRVPSPVMAGIGAFLAVIVLIGWTVYSNMHDADTSATAVPKAPVVTSIAPAPAATAAAPARASIAAVATAAPPKTTVTQPVSVADAMPVTVAGNQSNAPAAGNAPVPAAAGNTLKPAVAGDALKPAVAGATSTPPAASSDVAPVKEATSAKPAPKKKKAPVIRVRAPQSRVTLRATEASWVQISNAQGAVIYRKVLRTGEQYDVPDQKGLELDTANAGGLEVFVDGKRVQNLGAEGEILRGINLNPASLKIKREAIRG